MDTETQNYLNTTLYNELLNIYDKYIIINLPVLQDYEEELIKKHEYLPLLIRRYLHIDYYRYCKENQLTQVYNKIIESRHLTPEQYTEEFISWIKQHNEYGDLFNHKSYNQLQKELQKVKEEYSKIKL